MDSNVRIEVIAAALKAWWSMHKLQTGKLFEESARKHLPQCWKAAHLKSAHNLCNTLHLPEISVGLRD